MLYKGLMKKTKAEGRGDTSHNQEMDATASKQSVFEKYFIWKCRSKYVEQTLKIYTALTRLVFKWTKMKNTQSHIMIS